MTYNNGTQNAKRVHFIIHTHKKKEDNDNITDPSPNTVHNSHKHTLDRLKKKSDTHEQLFAIGMYQVPLCNVH